MGIVRRFTCCCWLGLLELLAPLLCGWGTVGMNKKQNACFIRLYYNSPDNRSWRREGMGIEFYLFFSPDSI
jgi:hypothetical protein